MRLLHFSHLIIFVLPQPGHSNWTQFFWFSILTPQLEHFIESALVSLFMFSLSGPVTLTGDLQ
jgi:hypothetical protein